MIMKWKWSIGLTVLLVMVMMTQSLYAAGIQLVSPNGNECYVPGSNMQIKWNYQQLDNRYVKIELLKNGVVTQVIKPSWSIGSAGKGMTNYYLPPNVTLGTDYRIRVSTINQSPQVTDLSDSNFSIFKPTVTLSTPNGGEKWRMGTTQQISWTTSGFSPGATLKTVIHLGKVSWNNTPNIILSSTPLPATSYAWTVGNFVPGHAPNTLVAGDDYYIRVYVVVENTNYPAVDISNAHFSITDKLLPMQGMPNVIKHTTP
jgi:hypothetical protein